MTDTNLERVAMAVSHVMYGDSGKNWQQWIAVADAAIAAMQGGGGVEIDYTNYRGERGIRTIVPTGRLLPGDDEFHPTAPWVIEAFDSEKGAMRTFDPTHIHRWGDQERRSSAKVFRSSLAAVKEALATPPSVTEETT